MGKKAKKSTSKSSKSSKRSSQKLGTIDGANEFTNGTADFRFPNGDKYRGEFCAHRSGLVWREGNGIYITKDGQVYQGLWKDDKLVEHSPLQITYPSGVKYNGRIVKNKYTGPGYYTLDNNLVLSCEFKDNKPKDELMIFRQNTECCIGEAGDWDALLYRENIFYKELSGNLGKGRSKTKLQPESLTNIGSSEGDSQQPTEEYWKDLEKQIFAKSTKTQAGPEDTSWADRYENFMLKRTEILDKIRNVGIGGLSGSEKKWYDKYMEFRKKRDLVLDRKTPRESEISTTLLERYLQEEMLMKQKCIPKEFVAQSTSSLEPAGSIHTDHDVDTSQ